MSPCGTCGSTSSTDRERCDAYGDMEYQLAEYLRRGGERAARVVERSLARFAHQQPADPLAPQQPLAEWAHAGLALLRDAHDTHVSPVAGCVLCAGEKPTLGARSCGSCGRRLSDADPPYVRQCSDTLGCRDRVTEQRDALDRDLQRARVEIQGLQSRLDTRGEQRK